MWLRYRHLQLGATWHELASTGEPAGNGQTPEKSIEQPNQKLNPLHFRILQDFEIFLERKKSDFSKIRNFE
jgi:hypothetical protein